MPNGETGSCQPFDLSNPNFFLPLILQIRLIMILATQARSQWTWFQRIMQEFHKRICLFYTGLIILLLEIAVVAFFADHLPFSLSMTIIASGIVFILISGGMVLYGLCRNSEYAPLRPEESVRHRTAQGHPEDFETEAATIRTWL